MAEDTNSTISPKTVKIKLDDGNEYTLKRPSLLDMVKAGIDIENMQTGGLSQLSKWVYACLRKHHPEMTADSTAELIPFDVVTLGKITETINELCGVSGQKNAEAGTGI